MRGPQAPRGQQPPLQPHQPQALGSLGDLLHKSTAVVAPDPPGSVALPDPSGRSCFQLLLSVASAAKEVEAAATRQAEPLGPRGAPRAEGLGAQQQPQGHPQARTAAVADPPGHGLTGGPSGGKEPPQALGLQVQEKMRHGLTMMLQTL